MHKILIVEDEFIIANHIQTVLEQKEIGICTIFDSYDDSIRWIKTALPDLALLDIRLFEDEDAGIRIARFIQNNYDIPFMFLSGYCDDATIHNAKQYNPVTFLTKPIIEKQVLAAVQIALPDNKAVKSKSVLLKGKYINQTAYEKLYKIDFSNMDFITKEIHFEDIAVIQSFNHIKRNSVLLKFKQTGCYFLVGTTIEKIKEICPSYFEQIHQSFIVNSHCITARKADVYVTVLNENIPVGSAYKHQIRQVH